MAKVHFVGNRYTVKSNKVKAVAVCPEGKLFHECITTPGTVCISSKGIPLAIGLLIVPQINFFGIFLTECYLFMVYT